MLNNIKRVAVFDSITDMRKGLNSLLGIAYKHNLDPAMGDVIIFGGKNQYKIKILHGDSSGLWLSSKLFTAENIRHGLKFFDLGIKEIDKNELINLVKGSISSVKNKKKS